MIEKEIEMRFDEYCNCDKDSFGFTSNTYQHLSMEPYGLLPTIYCRRCNKPLRSAETHVYRLSKQELKKNLMMDEW